MGDKTWTSIADRVLTAIIEFQAEHGRAPLQKEIAAHMGHSGRGHITRGLAKLRKDGRVRLVYHVEAAHG
jgi:hypothetical protein